MTNETQKKPVDVYQLVTDRIIAELEKGTVPWQQPWTNNQPPCNLTTGRPYRGVNTLLLGSLGYKENLFLSFKQAKDMGASIRKGEKSIPVIFWKQEEREDPKTQEKKKVTLLRYYNVFNIEQCDGIPKEKLPIISEREHTPIEACEMLIANMPNAPQILHAGDEAYYQPKRDCIHMPAPQSFKSEDAYYSTLFHEMVHSTGHESRLNRKEVAGAIKMGSEAYAIEELTAEIGAAFLKAETGLRMESIEDNAAYIDHWLKKLRNDKQFIVHASGRAQKATDYIRNERQVEKEVESQELNTDEQSEELAAARARSKDSQQMSR